MATPERTGPPARVGGRLRAAAPRSCGRSPGAPRWSAWGPGRGWPASPSGRPWDEAERLLEDERRTLAALEASGDALGTVPHGAAELVFFAVPQEAGAEVSFGHGAIDRELLVVDGLNAASERLGLDADVLLAEPFAHVDRAGVYRAPFGVAVKVARQCCRRFGGEVLRRVEERERELRGELVTGQLASGPRWVSPEAVRGHAGAEPERAAPIFALVRGWCGGEVLEGFDDAGALREEVDRLRALAEDTARWLRDSGLPVKAALLSKGLGRDRRGWG